MEILNINFEKKHPNSYNHTTSSTSKLIPEQHISRHNSIEEKPTTEIKQYTNEIQTTTTNDNNSQNKSDCDSNISWENENEQRDYSPMNIDSRDENEDDLYTSNDKDKQ